MKKIRKIRIIDLCIRLFVSWTVRNRTDRTTICTVYQQYSVHTCIVYNISNEQYTTLHKTGYMLHARLFTHSERKRYWCGKSHFAQLYASWGSMRKNCFQHIHGRCQLFVLGAAWRQTEWHRGQKTTAGANLSEVNPPRLPQWGLLRTSVLMITFPTASFHPFPPQNC